MVRDSCHWVFVVLVLANYQPLMARM